DGWLDILLINEPTCVLYRNRRDGTFEDVTRAAGLAAVRGPWKGCAVGDYDNDGWLDLFLTGFHDGALLRNDHGIFRRVTPGIRHKGWGSSAVFADLDGDGRLDLFAGNYVRLGPGDPLYCTFPHGVKGGCPPRVYTAEHGVMYRNL